MYYIFVPKLINKQYNNTLYIYKEISHNIDKYNMYGIINDI